MFKLFLFLCVLISISLKVRADLNSVAEKLIKQLKHEVAKRVKAFHEDSQTFLNEVFEAVPQFDKHEKEKVKSEINSINDEINDIKLKTRCEKEPKRDIANLESIGNSFNICSRKAYLSALSDIAIIQGQVENIESRTNLYDKRLADCDQSQACLKDLVNNLANDVKEFPATLEIYMASTRDVTDEKLGALGMCSRIDEIRRGADDIIDKFRSCSSDN